MPATGGQAAADPGIGGSSNGRTADSDSACLGSNPSPPANKINDLDSCNKAILCTFLSTRVKMAKFIINQSTLIVKYLFNNHGQAWYQRRVPNDLQERLGRTKFNIKLDPAAGQPIALVQRLAKEHDALFKSLRDNPTLTIPEKKLAALAILSF